jgi:hypothetical protein
MASRRCHSIGLIGSTLFRHRLWKGLLEALPRLALGCRRRKGLTTLLAERHARHLAGEHKLCKTPANQCTLTLLPFDLKLYKRTSLER